MKEYIEIDKKIKLEINAVLISKWILYFVFKEYKKHIGPLKLQKILWYVFVHYYFKYNEKLFDDSFEAWTFGPVVPSVWKYYRISFLNSFFKDIPNTIELPKNEFYFFEKIEETKIDLELLRKIKKSIKFVLDKKLNIESFKLVEETHKQTPWLIARDDKNNNNEFSRKKIIVNKKHIEEITKKYLF